MKARILMGWLVPMICGAAVAGCKDDAPTASATPDATASATAAPTAKTEAQVHQLPAFSEATNKRFRVELCFYGAQGLRLTRDAYEKSLGGKEPGEGKLPSFGEFPSLDEANAGPSASVAASATAAPSATPAAKPAPSAVASAAPAASSTAAASPVTVSRPTMSVPPVDRLPFSRYVSSCTLATRKEDKSASDEAIDKAVAEFDAWASNVNRLVMGAQRYYAAKQYESDKFERGRSVHKELTEAFAKLDEKFDALAKAFLAWEATLTKPSEKLDKAAEAGFDALEKSRALAAVLLSGKPEAEAVKKAAEAVAKARESLDAIAKEEPKSPYPRELSSRLGRLTKAAAKAEATLGEPGASKATTFLVMNEIAGLVEAHHRALGQHLRMTGQTRAGSPITSLRPRGDALQGVRPDARSLRARPPTQEEHPE